jgi:pimeloyl-ACP methyl ester carboxylesterase
MSSHQALIHRVLHGHGSEIVIVLHDWHSDHSNYDAVLPYLDTAAFTYVLVDLRGYGRSRDIAGEYTVAEIAKDCVALADQSGWQRFHLLGHSMTGMAVQRIAADVPARVKSVVAVCPVSAAGNCIDEATFSLFASTTEDDDRFRALLRYMSGGLSEQWEHAKLKQSRATVNPKCRVPYLTMLSRTNFVADVQGLQTPFLVMIGDHDTGLDAQAMGRTFLAWHPNTELVTVPNCGHYPMQECPPYFATVVERFMKRHM